MPEYTHRDPWGILLSFLLSAFSDAELRTWLALEPGLAPLRHALPGPTAPLEQLASATVELLQRQGLVDVMFWAALARQRPRRVDEIRLVQAHFGMPSWPDTAELAALCALAGIPPERAPATVGDSALHWLLLAMASKGLDATIHAQVLAQAERFPVDPMLLRALRAAASGQIHGIASELPPVWIQVTPSSKNQAFAVDFCAVDPSSAPPRAHAGRSDIDGRQPSSVCSLGCDLILSVELKRTGLRIRISGSAKSELRGALLHLWKGGERLAERLFPRTSDQAGEASTVLFLERRMDFDA